MTDIRIRKVFTSYDGGIDGVFDQIGEVHYTFSESPRDALEKEIDEFVNCLGVDPEEYKVVFTSERYAKLMEDDIQVADFYCYEEATLNIGFLGSLDLNDPEVLKHIIRYSESVPQEHYQPE